MEDFLKEIEEIKIDCSKPNWDGYDATPVNLKSIEYMVEFAKKLPSNLLKNAGDMLCPEPNGTLGMEFVSDKGRIAMSIDDEGILYYTSIIGNMTMVIEYDFGKKGIRQDILNMIMGFKLWKKAVDGGEDCIGGIKIGWWNRNAPRYEIRNCWINEIYSGRNLIIS